jgi:hypothetical protein
VLTHARINKMNWWLRKIVWVRHLILNPHELFYRPIKFRSVGNKINNIILLSWGLLLLNTNKYKSAGRKKRIFRYKSLCLETGVVKVRLAKLKPECVDNFQGDVKQKFSAKQRMSKTYFLAGLVKFDR